MSAMSDHLIGIIEEQRQHFDVSDDEWDDACDIVLAGETFDDPENSLAVAIQDEVDQIIYGEED